VVGDPTDFPARAVGQVETWFPDNPNPTFNEPDGLCSGVMLSRRHVLTSAHCLYDNETANIGQPVGQRANILAFSPARQGEKGRPYGTAFAVRARTYASYRNTQEPTSDVALITLDRNLGDNVGWFGAAAWSDASYPRNLNAVGYPGTDSGKFDGHTMVHQYDQVFISQTNDRYLRSNRIDSEDGHSGGPWFGYNADTQDVRVVGVLRGPIVQLGQNVAVRLTNDMLDDFRDAIDADLAGQGGGGGGGVRGFVSSSINTDGPADTVDRPDLVDRDQWFGTSLATVTRTVIRPGESFGATAWVHNTGTAAAGSFAVSFYASTDVDITSSDHLLGQTQISSLAEFASVDTSLAVSFPQIPAGQYYVGWLIDSGNARSEFNENNNRGILKGGTITVADPNHPPAAVADPFELEQDDVLEIPDPGVLFNDSDPNGDSLTAVVATGPSHGSLQISSQGGFVYTPDPGFHGQDSFTYRASDGEFFSEPATVTLTVLRANAPPLATPDQATVLQDETITIDVLANDGDGDGAIDPGSVLLASPPETGVATVLPDGRIQFEPAVGYAGVQSLRYTVADNEGSRSNEAEVTIIVQPRHAWQNPDDRLDTNDDGFVNLSDLLLCVHYLRSGKPRELFPPDDGLAPPDGYVDVNGDDVASVSDVVELVVFLRAAVAAAEGEFAPWRLDPEERWAATLDAIAADQGVMDIARS
jgi:V8-like Glu-specific endopeptidase